MFVHSVYFWLKEGNTPEDCETFRGGLESLRSISSVQALHIGQPVPSERPVLDGSYTFGLIVYFDDSAGHDAYQVDEIHRRFVESFASYWDRVLIYDMA